MFNNYVRDRWHNTPLNLAIVRLILSVYVVWKVLSVPWQRLAEYPVLFSRAEPLIIESFVPYLPVLQWIVILLTIPFVIGVYIRAVGVSLSVLISYLGVNLITVNTSGLVHSFFLASILLLLCAVFADEDKFSLDGIRHRSSSGIASLNQHLTSPLTPNQSHIALAVFLFGFASVYFGSGVAKVLHGGREWLTPLSMGRYIHPPGGFFPAASELFLQSELALVLAAVGTFVLELGFIVSVVTGLLFTPFIIGLITFHIGIAAVMGPFFLDFIIFLLLFANWEGLVSRVESTERIDIVYDDRCFFCTQSLYLFKYLDVNQSVYFLPATDLPEVYTNRQDVDYESAMYLFENGDAYRGYDAFRKLCHHLGVLRPVALLMALSPVKKVGVRIYNHIAANRSRYATCSIESN